MRKVFGKKSNIKLVSETAAYDELELEKLLYSMCGDELLLDSNRYDCSRVFCLSTKVIKTNPFLSSFSPLYLLAVLTWQILIFPCSILSPSASISVPVPVPVCRHHLPTASANHTVIPTNSNIGTPPHTTNTGEQQPSSSQGMAELQLPTRTAESVPRGLQNQHRNSGEGNECCSYLLHPGAVGERSLL